MSDEFTEKSFFLSAFHGTTLTFALSGESQVEPAAMDRFRHVLEELIAAGARVWILYHDTLEMGAALHEWVATKNQPPHSRNTLSHTLQDLCQGEKSMVVTGVGGQGMGTFWEQVVSLTTRFRVSRLVLPHSCGGVADPQGRIMSYVNYRLLGRMTQNNHPVLEHILALLNGGVSEVSLCRLADVGQELFTYQGSGTFFSWRHYCRVRPLVLNDFPRVEAIIRRGEREGYLLRRSDDALLDVLFGGYGAFIGGRHLAGVCGLLHEPYKEHHAGEIVSLYAMTRFKGEGVGVHLVARAKRDARRMGLHYLFACACRPGVVDFFCRNGFIPVAHEDVPPEKWQGYDKERKMSINCLRMNVREL
ncbi:MAG: GNAT family N-acetyltransferase [Magnetococcales bacterium]|nr:GNAT family N-acetyltransferase [Magnetococcales bacterium]MBF0321572.1 GNAT family N-acetyltransferase [Magnetococcales bacterium]